MKRMEEDGSEARSSKKVQEIWKGVVRNATGSQPNRSESNAKSSKEVQLVSKQGFARRRREGHCCLPQEHR